MGIVYPSIWWHYLPPLRVLSPSANPLGNLKQFIVPAVILGMELAGLTMRMARTTMLEVLRQDYIRTAWAKGLREGIINSRHALKNALGPVITIIGLQSSVFVGGTIILEQIFCLPGMSLLIMDGIKNRDKLVVCGIVLIFAVFVLIVNLVIDLIYSVLDPRIRYT